MVSGKTPVLPWKKFRPLIQNKTPANEFDIADGLDNTCHNWKSGKG
jgi:hypothetical protein